MKAPGLESNTTVADPVCWTGRRCLPSVDLTVHTVGEEPEVLGLTADVDDVQDLVGRAFERDRVLVRRHEVGSMIDADALVRLLGRPDLGAEPVAQMRDLVGLLRKARLTAQEP